MVIVSHELKTLDGLKNIHLKKTENDKVSINSTNGQMVYAGSFPIPLLDTDDFRDGWLYHKTAVGSDKFNYYLYANTNSSYQYKFSDLKTVDFTASIDSFVGFSAVPFVVVYSKPTGSGDAGAFYHSKRTFTMPNSTPIVGGEQLNFYSGVKREKNNNNRYVELSFLITEGDNLDTEEILYITIHTDSLAPINTKILMSHFGYNLKNEIQRNVKLV